MSHWNYDEEGARSDVGCRERMQRDSGIKDRDERSRGIEIEILMSDNFAKIKPTKPFCVFLLHSNLVWTNLVGHAT